MDQTAPSDIVDNLEIIFTPSTLQAADHKVIKKVHKILEKKHKGYNKHFIKGHFKNNDVVKSKMRQRQQHFNVPAKDKKNRAKVKHIPKAPISAAIANLLPSISQEGDEDDHKLLFKNSPMNPQHLKQQQGDYVGRISPRGPEIGTVIKIASEVRKEEEVPYCDDASTISALLNSCASSAIASLHGIDSSNVAFSKQAATNSTFLFSDEPVRPCRQMPVISKVDQQRLSLINIEEVIRHISGMSSPATSQSTEEDPIETIRKLAKEKKNRVTSASGNQSAFISKKECGYTIHNSGFPYKVFSTTNHGSASSESDKETAVQSQAGSESTAIPIAPEKKYIVTEFKAKSLQIHGIETSTDTYVELIDAETTNRNENVDTIASMVEFLIPTTKKRKVLRVVEDDDENGISYVSLDKLLDELSLADLQKKYSAITPMKTKSPYTRCKKAICVFDDRIVQTFPHSIERMDHQKKIHPRKKKPSPANGSIDIY